METVTAILLAGGRGTRFGSSTPKQFLPLGDQPIALHSFLLFKKIPWIQEIIVVTDLSHQNLFPGAQFASPGMRRQDSVQNGLALSTGDYVLIHDSARPFVTEEECTKLFSCAKKTGAALLATPIQTTIKQCAQNGYVEKTLPREKLFAAATPQICRRDWLKSAFAQFPNINFTDDTSLLEKASHPVQIVPCSPRNLKITTPQDLQLAEQLLHATV